LGKKTRRLKKEIFVQEEWRENKRTGGGECAPAFRFFTRASLFYLSSSF
jgi:hypothetical protein